MAKRDYYEILGVGKDADGGAIKSAYRRLAMKHHPDRNNGDAAAEAKFKEAQEAYSCLSDEKKRAAYDRFGHAAFDGGGGGGGAGPEFSSFFNDIFSDFFGDRAAGARRSRRRRVLDIELSLEEMVRGCEKKIRLSLPQACDHCKGSGAAPGSRPKRCDACGGAGQVRAQRGVFTLQQTCPKCGGAGRMVDNPCRQCGGEGRVTKTRQLSVKLPPGIEDGALVRVNAGGDDEILLRPTARPHPLFSRDGDDLHIEVPVSVATAALGGEVDVPAITGGKIKISIPEGTQSGQAMRVPGRGAPNMRSPRRSGDMLCHVFVETPVKLSAEQKTLLRQFEDSLKNKHSPKGKSWLDKAKAFFAE